MDYLRLPGTELAVFPLCYGAAAFGTSMRGDEMDRLFQQYRATGGNFFDTAHCYAFWMPDGLGASERALGDCLRRFGGRKEMVIASKGGHHGVPPDYPRPDDFLALEVLSADITDSLERLRIETIDLYWLHRDDERRDVGSIIEALNAEIVRGRIRYPGASNWSTARIAAANAYAAAHGLQGFVASQPQWSLAVPVLYAEGNPPMRFLTPEDHAWHVASGLPVIPFSSTARGYFAAGGREDAALNTPATRARLARVQQLAPQLGCTPNQLALAYLRHQPFPVIPILGTSNPAHLADALGTLRVTLTAEQVRWLEG